MKYNAQKRRYKLMFKCYYFFSQKKVAMRCAASAMHLRDVDTTSDVQKSKSDSDFKMIGSEKPHLLNRL